MGRPLIPIEEASDLGTKLFVVSASPAEPSISLGGVEPEGLIKQVVELTPAFRCHSSPPRSWPPHQA